MPTETKKPLFNIEEIKVKLTSQPQIQELLSKIRRFWSINGFRMKIGVGAVGLLVIVVVAVRIGLNIAALNQPKQVVPSAIPTVVPTVQRQKVSVFEGLKDQVTNFSTLLPDPAPPAVDQKIGLVPSN